MIKIITQYNPSTFPPLFRAGPAGVVYHNSPATALKPQTLIDATLQFYSLSGGNVHRSLFAVAQILTARYEAARDQV
ncbi:aminotransferase class V-fold PLP-dependent enzyme, partial [Kosakonia cowanii]|uniref:aminotransferase class V-fold PLP-dependent enzyme n=1 Tax=Kosakonia cowanii TaxID=208223 RepID=UPI0039A5B5A5